MMTSLHEAAQNELVDTFNMLMDKATKNGCVDIFTMLFDKATEIGHLKICKEISDFYKKPKYHPLYTALVAGCKENYKVVFKMDM